MFAQGKRRPTGKGRRSQSGRSSDSPPQAKGQIRPPQIDDDGRDVFGLLPLPEGRPQ